MTDRRSFSCASASSAHHRYHSFDTSHGLLDSTIDMTEEASIKCDSVELMGASRERIPKCGNSKSIELKQIDVIREQITVNQQEEEMHLETARSLIKKIIAIPLKNLKTDIKIGLMKLEEALDAGAACRMSWKNSTEELKRGTTIMENKELTRVSPATNEMEDDQEHWEKVLSKKKRKNKNEERKSENIPMERVINDLKITAVRESGQRSYSKLRRRPEAVIIKPMKGKTYADVLKDIRTKVKPEDDAADIRSIRQTRDGAVLLEFKKTTLIENREKFSKSLREALGQDGVVKAITPRTTLEIRDMDGITTVADVEEAVRRDTGNTQGELKISVSKPNSRGQKLAIFTTSDEDAHKLLEAGRIKIGWLYCRVRARIFLPRCFRCLSYGHLAGKCDGPNRSKLCFKCGESGHKVVDCKKNTFQCMLCTDKGVNEVKRNHAPGSGACTVFREALEKVKHYNK